MPEYCRCPSCTYDPPDTFELDYYDDDDASDYDADDLIRSYNYKPEPVFHGDGPVYLGAEIEVAAYGQTVTEAARLAYDRLGDLAYLKEDGSVSGFEIVTHPMSYQYAMTEFPWDLLPDLCETGAEATASCGIHVHVSRDGFSGPSHTYRWMKFIYRNQHAVTKFARRESAQWAPFRRDERANIKIWAKKVPNIYDDGYYYPSRYQAINVTNEHTLEVRVFAGSLSPSRVQAALGFVAASVEYTRSLTAYDIAHNGGWEWGAFAKWVSERPEYAPLHVELESMTCAF